MIGEVCSVILVEKLQIVGQFQRRSKVCSIDVRMIWCHSVIFRVPICKSTRCYCGAIYKTAGIVRDFSLYIEHYPKLLVPVPSRGTWRIFPWCSPRRWSSRSSGRTCDSLTVLLSNCDRMFYVPHRLRKGWSVNDNLKLSNSKWLISHL